MSDIILPKEINDGYFKEFFEKINEIMSADEFQEDSEKTIYIICDGNGGDFDEVMCMIEYMKMLKDVTFYGYVLSGAYSGHSLIWCACNERSCSEFAVMGVHDQVVSIVGDIYSTKSISDLFKTLTRNMSYMARIYEKACKQDVPVDWYQILYDTGTEFVIYTRPELVRLGIVKDADL